MTKKIFIWVATKKFFLTNSTETSSKVYTTTLTVLFFVEKHRVLPFIV